ncbi:TPA: hypothetical protein EYN98_02990 [Candidatus Poribacteria bacterium]|jgi:hypothetical protein|nr:hypothetical protein [Candidatus Poribacteria bacterium]HIA65033.1 hypothetical protein [Candidatus Poribacteria bacterium]HIB89398.1 hypothetical protein [Candidatus Poribacteria bacterium]
MKRLVWLLILVVLTIMAYAGDKTNKTLTIDDIFPSDRVLDVKVTVEPKDWDTIRKQSQDFETALADRRQYHPIDSPYTYVEATVSIDGVIFLQVGIRKKGFLGSSRNPNRPSLKVKLNQVDKTGQIDGLTNLTFNNNEQDPSLISQFMGYSLFNQVGLPAPRCAYAKLTVNGQDLGVYTHVERIHKPLLKRAFGNEDGVLYEGTLVDFYPDWAGSFEHKLGSDEVGRPKVQQLIEMLRQPDENIETDIGKLVDLDSFYTFWAMEGLLGFWDGYSGNRNNFFIYLNPETDKFHFIPWGADGLFERFSPSWYKGDKKDPVSVKIRGGLIANQLYQLELGRQRYEQTLRKIIEQRWNEKDLLAETERIEALVKPYLTTTQSRLVQSADKFVELLAEKRKFIRQRRGEIMTEIAEGMPKWEVEPVQPFVISRMEQEIPFYFGCITGGCIGCVSTILVSWLINR